MMEDDTLLSDCHACSEILKLLRLPPGRKNIVINLGPVSQLLASQCKNHVDVVELAKPMTQAKYSSAKFEELNLFLCRTYHETAIKLGLGFNEPSSHTEEIHLQHVSEHSASHQLGRVIDPEWIDPDFIRSCKRRCLDLHGSECEIQGPIHHIPNATPLWVIDTLQQCIVSGKSADRFVTLSYVWGKVESFATKLCNLETLKHPGALNTDEIASKIPQTIKDAMAIVQQLDERFLWVDALCIVQDDIATKMDELNKMAKIYATSILTIIAGDGPDSQFGLRGLQGISGPRSAKQLVTQFGPHGNLIVKIISSDAEYLFNFDHLPYYIRAWTYQEYIFSKSL